MSVKNKIIFVFLASCVLILGFSLTFTKNVLTENLKKLDKKNTENKIIQTSEFLDYDLNKLGDILHKFSSWDATCNFINNHNQSYIDSVFVRGTFVGSNINFFVYLDNKNKIVYKQFYDLILDKKIDFPNSILKQISKNYDYIKLENNNKSKFKTIINSSIGPVMISALPILDSYENGPVKGTIIIGRIINELILEDYRKVIATNFEFVDKDEINGKQVEEILECEYIIEEFDNELLAFFNLGNRFPDNLFIKITNSRENYLNGVEFVNTLLVVLSTSIIFFFIFAYILIDYLVTDRLKKLTKDISKIKQNPNQAYKLHSVGNDEITALARETRELIVALAEVNRKRTEELREKKIIEQQVIENQFYLRKIIDIVPHAIYAKDIDGKFIFVNEALAKYYGVDISVIEGSDQRDLHKQLGMYPPLEQIASDKVVIEEKKPIIITNENFTTVYDKNIIVETEKFPLEYKGKIIAAGISIDYTERYWTEKKIEESEGKFRSLVELANDGIAILQDQKIVYANPFLCKLLNYTIDEFLILDIDKIVHQDDLTFVLDRYFKRLKGDEDISPYIIRLLTRNNKTISVELSGAVFNHNDKNATMVFINDITARLAYEHELKSNELLYRSIFELTASGILIESEEGIILEVNEQLCKMLEYTRDELVGNHIKMIVANEYHNIIEDNIKTLKEGINSRSKTKNVTKNGELKTLEISETKVKLPDGKIGILVTTHDITEKEKIDSQLRYAKNRAENADKLKSEFLALVSHEIRTPINTILSFSSLIKDDLEDKVDEDLRSSFGGIAQAGKRIIRTIDLILNMSELQIGTYDYQPRALDLYNSILDNIYIEQSMVAASKRLKLSLEKETDNLYIKADEYSVTQIMDHLVDNAIKYTREGEVKIVCTRDTKNRLVVKIKDTGIGISREYLNHLFEPFSQEHRGYTRPFEGNGLGLALVKNYCNLNNILLEVDSIKGKGTTFSVVFPDTI